MNNPDLELSDVVRRSALDAGMPDCCLDLFVRMTCLHVKRAQAAFGKPLLVATHGEVFSVIVEIKSATERLRSIICDDNPANHMASALINAQLSELNSSRFDDGIDGIVEDLVALKTAIDGVSGWMQRENIGLKKTGAPILLHVQRDFIFRILHAARTTAAKFCKGTYSGLTFNAASGELDGPLKIFLDGITELLPGGFFDCNMVALCNSARKELNQHFAC